MNGVVKGGVEVAVGGFEGKRVGAVVVRGRKER